MKNASIHLHLFPFVSTLLVTVLLAACLAGCSCDPDHYRIGVSQCLDDAWRQKMNEEMSRELLLHPRMRLTTRVADGSSVLQCAQIDSFISEKVDLLIVSPNETEEVQPAVTRAYEAGIPVIIADRLVPGQDWTAFIGGDNERVGELMAEWIMSHYKEGLHVLEVTGLPHSAPTMLRHEGMMHGLEASDMRDIRIASVMGSWQRKDAYREVKAYLAMHRDVDLIVAQNDLMAIGAADAVHDSRHYRSRSVPIMGVDGIVPGLQAILDGTIECTATYPSRGDLIIETAAHILEGKAYDRETILETILVEETTARAMLEQYHERIHDLETLKIVQIRSDMRWQQMKRGRWILIGVIVLVCLLFVLALVYIVYTQRKMQREIKKEILPQLEDVQEAMQLSKRDEVFQNQMKQMVDEHLTDPNLNVEYLAEQLHLSRTQIFRKVKTITGKGPLDYIRERRLVRADEMLRMTDMTVQQVSIELCFSSPGYFSKCYKEYFGRLPGARN